MAFSLRRCNIIFIDTDILSSQDLLFKSLRLSQVASSHCFGYKSELDYRSAVSHRVGHVVGFSTLV